MASEHPQFLSQFDAVVMLTWSDWHTEMRSNRYHYATRFAKHLQVIFVQPDLVEQATAFEPTTIANFRILHVCSTYGRAQTQLVADALRQSGIERPLLWIYNVYFEDLVKSLPSPFRIYHATEDYFRPGAPALDSATALVETVNATDMLVAVSDGVHKSYLDNANYLGRSVVLTNGCDYHFWSQASIPNPTTKGRHTALYQGGIHRKIDLAMMGELARLRRDWDFWFCGALQSNLEAWNQLVAEPNIRYFGCLTVEEVRDLAAKATVGIIPFVQDAWITAASFPLKAFEYIAAGLPVVTVSIDALQPYGNVFRFANTAEEFSAQLVAAAGTRSDPDAVAARRAAAQLHDYDVHFDKLLHHIEASTTGRSTTNDRLNVLVLYDDRSTFTATTREHVESFGRFSRHQIWYSIGILDGGCSVPLKLFDVVILHYSVRLSVDWYIAPGYAEALQRYDGHKVLFVQDEYENTEKLRTWIERLGIHLVYTCVPDEYRDKVYSPSRFPHTDFIQNLTGYVPDRLETMTPARTPAERTTLIGYRGRALPYWYGDLGQEKLRIGVEMRRICEERGLDVDIEWDEKKRIYGSQWYDWLQSCRATLGTESGANVFDDRGELQASVKQALQEDPGLTYESARARFFGDLEGQVRMNQISPRVFEAIACRTALILFDGRYSSVLQPDAHYIALRKDFSNIDEVLTKLQDADFIEAMVERAHADIIATGRWNYRTFVGQVDQALDQRVQPRAARPQLVSLLVGTQGPFNDKVQPALLTNSFRMGNACLSAVLENQDFQIPVTTDTIAQHTPVRTWNQDDPIAILKAVVEQKLRHRPFVLKTMVLSYQTLAKVHRGATAVGRGVGRLFRRRGGA